MDCNANSSCSNAYINITWNDRQSGIQPSSLNIYEPGNTKFKFICAGDGIGICELKCDGSNSYPNGGVNICTNGFFDCGLASSTCKWNCIDSTYNYCYNNTMDCLTSDDNTKCYKQNAKNFQVNPIYSTSPDPTGSPTPEPTMNVSAPTASPVTRAPHPTHPCLVIIAIYKMYTKKHI